MKKEAMKAGFASLDFDTASDFGFEYSNFF